MLQPLTHVFAISTVYVGMPLGSRSVGLWFICITDLLHFSSTLFPLLLPSASASHIAASHYLMKNIITENVILIKTSIFNGPSLTTNTKIRHKIKTDSLGSKTKMNHNINLILKNIYDAC